MKRDDNGRKSTGRTIQDDATFLKCMSD